MYIKNIFTILVISTTFFSCNKSKLNEPTIGLLDEVALANKKGVEGLLIGAYSVLDGEGLVVNGSGVYGSSSSNWIYGSICGSEAYTGGIGLFDQTDALTLETFTATPLNSYAAQKWAAVYDGVARANTVLRIMRKATDMTTKDTIEVRAEALFLRAFYHFEAKKIWNRVPFVDETITVEAGNYHLPNDKDIWPDIENDLLYAKENLPVKQSASGRANRFAAEALLAKAYMFQQKYSQAQPLLQDIITQGKNSSGIPFSLAKNYHDNFDPAKKNNPESVFAVQMSVNDEANNGNTGDFINYPTNISYGFFQPSQYLVNHFKTDPLLGLPYQDTYNDVDVKNDEGIKSDQPFTPYAGALDPRLDWTVGRRGIPYLDWGTHPGNEWIREQSFGGPYSPKKNTIAQNQVGQYAQDGWGPAIDANNVNLIRFADIILWAAEVEVEIGSLDKAVEYVNMIRNRIADNHQGWVHQYLDDNNPLGGFYTDDAHLAANYFINPYPQGYFTSRGKDFARKAVYYERMLELGMEGHRFFDLIRWKIADKEINDYLKKEKNLRDYLKLASFKDCNAYFPIPQVQIDLSAGVDGKAMMIQSTTCY